MERILAILSLLIIITDVGAQSLKPEIINQGGFGGSGRDKIIDIAKVDNGYLMIANTTSDDHQVSGYIGTREDVWLVKLDEHFSIQWQNAIGGSNIETAVSVLPTYDGQFLVAADTWSSDGEVANNYGPANSSDIWLIKVDTSGNITWQQNYGGTSGDLVREMIATRDNGFALVGYTQSQDIDITVNKGLADCWVLKLDSTGALQWQVTLGGSYNDYGSEIIQTKDGGYLVLSRSSSADGDITQWKGLWSIWAVKLDSNGNMEWERTYGSEEEEVYDLAELDNGNYIISGSTNAAGYRDMEANYSGPGAWIFSIDSLGNILWQNGFSTTSNPGANTYGVVHEFEVLASGQIAYIRNIAEPGKAADMQLGLMGTAGSFISECTYGGSDHDGVYSTRMFDQHTITCMGMTSSTDLDLSGVQNYGGLDGWLVMLRLDVVDTIYASICKGDSLLGYDSTGVFRDTFHLAGYDSIRILNLTVFDTGTIASTVSICEGESYFAGGAWQTNAGLYGDTLQTAHGCDSLITHTRVAVEDTFWTTDTVVINQGDSIYAGGAWQTVSGTFVDVYTTLLWGCDSTVITLLDVVSSIEELGASQFAVFPNPTKELLNIQFEAGNTTEQQLCLVNTMGQMVRWESISEGILLYQLSTKGLASGIYVLTLVSDEERITKKILIE